MFRFMNICKLAAMATTVIAAISLTSCHESLEDRAERESREYTKKFCPTPPQNNVVTDSLVFHKTTRTQTYNMHFTGELDDAEAIGKVKDKLVAAMLENVRHDTGLQTYKDEGFTFEYIYRSEKNPQQIILQMKFGPKDYR